ncbi:MAG: hypothetical protein LBR10_13215 [Prevotellaceae bacterium]|jgi:hypothetical protein|nr:hypothetical protein [Prevotellaceae bacterium]
MFKDKRGNYRLKIAFDFDDTLTEPLLFLLAQRLIRKGHDVWILTARCSYDQYLKYFPTKSKQSLDFNDDLLEAAEELGLEDKIIYTDNEDKKDFFVKHNFDILFDDDADWHCNPICEAGGIAINI